MELRPGACVEIVFFLGEAVTLEEARSLIVRYRPADLDVTLRTVVEHWDDVLGAVQVTTPDRAMNVLLNRWLLYQTLACRIWARGAFYQAGGAYGFRDQLQDVMALAVAQQAVARTHILRAAARQFIEGDVQHWWHPPSGRGVRTRISDDLLWLPYAVIHYLEVTRDSGLLDTVVPFLEGPALAEGQDESYFQPQVSEQHGTLFEHCARALDRSLSVGSHGLPLIGTGDWNDGMNRVGHGGKGESVWLGWFLHTVLWEFAQLADGRGEHQRAERWRRHVSALKGALEHEAWDGEWYRRAYFDDGTPLGSATNAECRIDAIAQSWGVLSGAAAPARGARAMAAVEEYLVRRGDRLVLLFTPPFDRTPLDPGYIKGYLPGVRENGGQYTHAAIWSLLAFAALGDGDKAGELFAMLNPINHASTATRSNHTLLPPTFMLNRHTSAAVDGRGTPDPRGGCIGPALSGSWGFVCEARCCISTPVSRAGGRALRWRSAITHRVTKLLLRTPMVLRAGCRPLCSMAHHSRAAGLFRSPMIGQRTRCALALGQSPLVGAVKFIL
jgi:cyclic beta-1,2-glucan glucanotransferase